MNRPAIALLALALSFGTLAACGGSGTRDAASQTQPAGGSAAAGRHRMGEVLSSLGLSDAQKSQIRDIMRGARDASKNADPATRRANYKAALAKIDTVLTPDQQKRFDAKMAEMRNQRQQGAAPQS